MKTLWIDAFLLTVVLCVTCGFLSFPVHSVFQCALWVILTKSLMFLFELSHCSHCFQASMTWVSQLIRAGGSLSSHKSNQRELSSIMWSLWHYSSGRKLKACTSGAAGLSNAHFSWWGQLFNLLPHPGHFLPLHAVTAPALSCWCCSTFCHLGQLAALCLSVVLPAVQS